MSTVETSRDEISKRYGRVLFELAQENQVIKNILKEADILQKCLSKEAHDWRRIIGPVVPVKTQLIVIEKLSKSLKLSKLLENFLIVLTQHRRLPYLESIFSNFRTRTEETGGIIHGTIEVVSLLTKKQIETLQQSLKSKTGKQVQLSQKINEDILGGIILHIESLMIDASLGTQINKIRNSMKG